MVGSDYNSGGSIAHSSAMIYRKKVLTCISNDIDLIKSALTYILCGIWLVHTVIDLETFVTIHGIDMSKIKYILL